MPGTPISSNMNISPQNLPDYLSPEELQQYFLKLLDAAPKMDAVNVVDALWELADRQWHTYTCLDDGIKTKVDKYVSSLLKELNWTSKGSVNLMRETLAVIGNLGLQESYAQVLSLENRKDIHRDVYIEIERFLDQIRNQKGNQILDPYFDTGQ
ncbi:MAG: hypothetical protein ACOYYF_11095 [Chloroflexota bacterium]|nr:hypothetical protein [Chloroflexota bacterium]MBI5702494.1 hypothetical protein [Chloroflexota bacterium]